MYGWLTIKGKRYYVNAYSGRATGYTTIYNKLYLFNKKGQLTKCLNYQNGWQNIGGNKYYFHEGDVVTGTHTIKGKTYLFDYDGKLVRNASSGSYFADKNGVIIRNAWRKVNGRLVYYGKTGSSLTGVWKIGKKVYYFN